MVQTTPTSRAVDCTVANGLAPNDGKLSEVNRTLGVYGQNSVKFPKTVPGITAKLAEIHVVRCPRDMAGHKSRN